LKHRFELPGERGVLLGEMADWRNGLPLPCEIELGELPYQYKLLVNERDWRLDPAQPRTRASDGHRNSLIGGAPEPWLFGPGAPWVVELASGELRVLFGVRRGREVLPSVSWREGGAWTTTNAEPAFEEDEHVFFVTRLPVSSGAVTLSLGGHEFAWRRAPARERLPAWWASAVIYGIFVDRFRPAEDGPEWRRAPVRGAPAGGHLDGIVRSVDYLRELGVNTLYLTPVHVGASAHRYDVVDPLVVDPALGGEEAYARLVASGLRIIQDVSFAHAGHGFAPYEDVRANGRASRFAPWFQWKNGELVHYGRRRDAPLFDLECADVQALAIETIERWAKRGVKGLRLDMTAEIPIALGQRIRKRFRELVPDGAVFGELVPQHAWRWREAGVLDAATDFDFHRIVGDLTAGDITPAAAFSLLARSELLRGDDARRHAVRFLSTHDHVRLATRVRGSRRLACAEALLAVMPGVPLLHYGEEHRLQSTDPQREIEDVWPDRMPMLWGPSPVSSLLRLRAESEALRTGDLSLLHADDSTLVIRRRAGREVVDVAINFSSDPKTIELEDDELPRMSQLGALNGGSVQDARISLPPFASVVARRVSSVSLRARRNLHVRDDDLRRGSEVPQARPSRFFFAVTERCNLRCAHCITHAPERTASGTARTMTPAVLAALAPSFAYGEYFAFTHGGESLTTPIFWDVLAAMAQARGDEPYVAHLLTNGLLLDLATAKRLHASGVTSVSISLDGATAATNDAIRIGGRFDDVVAQLREVAQWRRSEKIDLRLGISTVLLQQNLDALDAMVDLAASLGVDWLKLEEGVPATDFARRSLVAPPAERIERLIASARARFPDLVIVDHTRERAVWRCRLDDDTRAFLAADEHANRAVIHPCRTPWETIAIEPNGDVRIGDVFGPLLGNVLASELAELWLAEPARAQRVTSTQQRLCGAGPVVCLDRGAPR
jgi:glycosidase/MoaA/NifB/PqqE/SkfB family radical SAM enzyme